MWQVGTLRALSTLCAEREANRKQLVDARAMGPIVRALDDSLPEVGGGPVVPIWAPHAAAL